VPPADRHRDETPSERHEALRQSEERFRLLVESVKDYAIFRLDPTGVIASWNLGAERIKGYRADEIVGQHFSRLYPEEDARSGKPDWELREAAREGRFEDEGWRIRKDGTRFWANVVITALRDAHGELVGFAKVTRDLTERRRAEQERLHLAEQAAARESAERVVGLLTHLHSLGGSLVAELMPDQMAALVVKEGVSALRAKYGLFVRPIVGQLELVASHGVDERLAQAWRWFPVDARGPLALAYTTRRPQWLEDWRDHDDSDLPQCPAASSFAALPLALGDQVLGVLGFCFDEPRCFPPEERAILLAMVSQTAQALDRAHTYKREVAARRRVETLGELSRALSGASLIDDVARVVVDKGMQAAQADICALYTLDERTGSLDLVAERGCNSSVIEHIRHITPGAGNPAYQTIATGECLWIETEEEYAAFYPALARLRAEGPRARAFWSAPLVAEGRATGLLAMGFYEARRFPREEREFVATFTRQCAEALLRARRLEAERTARQLAEKLQASLSITLHSIGDAVIAADAKGIVTLMNPVAASVTGWTEADARGRPLSDVFRVVSEETCEPLPTPVDRVLREGTVVGFANHTLLISRDGREIPIDDSGAPIQGEDGAIDGVVLVFRDVTERRRAESRQAFLVEATATLGESLDHEATLRNVAHLLVPRLADWCAVDVVHDGERRPKRLTVMHADPSKIKLAEEFNAKYPPRPEAPTGVANVLRTGRSEIYSDIPDELLVANCVDDEHLRMARELRLRSAMVVPLLARGRVLGAMTFVFAESGRRYSREDLEFAEELARRCATAIDNARLYASERSARESADIANRAKDEFLAMVSHELRTPLNAIMGWAKIMSSPDFDEVRRDRAVETIGRNAVAMRKLIEDLLDMSRIISGKMLLDVQPVDLARCIEAAIESIRPAADAKDIEVTPVLDRLMPPFIGDPTRLQQIVWNLLSNAVKFTPRDGRIGVVLRARGAWVEVSVTDTGQGIAAHFLPYVFDAFRQQDAGYARSRGGLGLGLTIARQLIELHGGRVEAHSAGEGLGATFTVLLPVPSGTRVDAASAGRKSTPRLRESVFERPAQLEGLRVLVVDDEKDARELVEAILEDCGCCVTVAGSVDDALSSLARQLPDVLVSDIGMPERDGYDLIRQVRALPHDRGGDVPAAALTAYARAEDRRRMLNAGFSMYVPKPVEPAELVAVVAALSQFTHRDRVSRQPSN
jgi:PAS domain S-box-containing protein